MLKSIKMPDLSTTGNEIQIMKWQKEVGDEVKRGEILLDIETDKCVMHVESYLAGYLKKILIPEGEVVSVGDEIALIGSIDDAV